MKGRVNGLWLLSAVLVMVSIPDVGLPFEGATNTFYGASAGNNNSSGNGVSNDTFIGAHSGYWNNTGTDNTFIGWEAGALNLDGSKNTFIGSEAGYANLGPGNSFMGYAAGKSNTYGGGNTFVGEEAGFANQIGHDNSFFGVWAGHSNTSGIWNVFLGAMAGQDNQSGGFNTFTGIHAGVSNTDGSDNVYVGANAFAQPSSSKNTLIGSEINNTSIGNQNIMIGFRAGGSSLPVGNNRLYIDNCYTDNTPATGGLCTQPFIYGEFDNRLFRIDGRLETVTVATPSDLRYKKEIQPLEASLDKVLNLRGVIFRWDQERVHGAGYRSDTQIGFIAQEVEKILPELVQTDSKGYKTLLYDKVVPVLVEALKEQHREIREKYAELEALKKALLEITSRLMVLENAGKTVASR